MSDHMFHTTRGCVISENLNVELGARLVALSCFRWRDAMYGICRRPDPFETTYAHRIDMRRAPPYLGMVPDMTDMLTVYAVLDLIEELWQEPGGPHRGVWLEPLAYGWRVRGLRIWDVSPPGYLGLSPKPTRAEAVVAALEATEGRF